MAASDCTLKRFWLWKYSVTYARMLFWTSLAHIANLTFPRKKKLINVVVFVIYAAPLTEKKVFVINWNISYLEN